MWAELINPLLWDFAGWTQKIRDIKDFALELFAICAFVANFLPKAEKFACPKLRTAYKWFLLNPVAFFALNWRKVHSLKDKKNV